MELILLILLILSQNKKDGKPSFDFEKLAPLLSTFTDIDLSALKNFNLQSLLPENLNISEILKTASAFSAFSGDGNTKPNESANATFPPLQPISKIADANVTHALNAYFSETDNTANARF